MVVKPKVRGFICTTAHPDGCAKNVEQAAERVRSRIRGNGPGNVLVIGASTGYGLAGRIAAAFGYGAGTVGVFFEKSGSGNRTGTAGWYNSAAFDRLAAQAGLACASVNGDAFTDAVKKETIEAIRKAIPGGQVDFVLYSLAAPRKTDPVSGEIAHSVIKPIGQNFGGKTVNFHTGEVSYVDLAPASEEEIRDTVTVMGGEDWLNWMKALSDAGVLAPGAATAALSYIGPELTHAVYRDGTIGRAKADIEKRALEIDALLAPQGGKAFVSVNKAVVTQSSSAIPVVPLYMSLLFKIMKEKGIHEDCTDQMARFFTDRLGKGGPGAYAAVPTDEAGRIRLDDYEMEPDIQAAVMDLWDRVDSDNIMELSDLSGYREDFFSMFGFGVEGVDYEKDVEI